MANFRFCIYTKLEQYPSYLILDFVLKKRHLLILVVSIRMWYANMKRIFFGSIAEQKPQCWPIIPCYPFIFVFSVAFLYSAYMNWIRFFIFLFSDVDALEKLAIYVTMSDF